MDVKEFAKGFTADQREKLRDCKSADDIIACCKDNGIALPDEVLESVAGGSFDTVTGPMKIMVTCGTCGMNSWYCHDTWLGIYYECANCGDTWENHVI